MKPVHDARPALDATLDAVLGLLVEHSGAARGILCLDGRAGTGKSTLARAIAVRTGATVVATDDLCPGWVGLPRVPALLAALVEPLAAGKPGRYPRWDWIAGRVGDPVVVEPAPLIVLEGVGAGARALRPWRTALIRLEAPLEERRRRALDRDGDTFAPWWDRWAAAEEQYLATDADTADLVLTT